MIDPLIGKAISLGFAALFLLGAWHKWSTRRHFRETLENYQLLPTTLVAPASFLIPLLEALLGVGWLSGFLTSVTATISVALLGIYAMSMGINLLRGRVHIGCGCGLSTASDEQPLSLSLIFRNIVLMAMAWATTLPHSTRPLGAIDFLTLVLALLASALLYVAASQLLTNRSAMASWSRSRD